jgi:hypothetical protein
MADAILQLPDRAARAARLRQIDCPKTRAAVRFFVEDNYARRYRKPLPDYDQILAEETHR